MATSALLLMDLQVGIVDRIGPPAEGLLATLAGAAGAARVAGIPVLFVRVAFRPGAPEISRRNAAFARARDGSMGESDPGTQIHPSLAPRPVELVLTKRRVSAFSGSDLEVVLRALEVDTLVLSGVATSGVVLSTLRQAADLDFGLTVLADGCWDPDPEVHRVLLEKVFPRQATVVTAAAWAGGIPAG